MEQTYLRPTHEVWEAFSIHVDLLKSSNALFDTGKRHEGCRIAAAIYLLVGRGQRHHRSICDSLGIQNNFLYKSSIPEGAQGTQLTVVHLESLGDGGVYLENRPFGVTSINDYRNLVFEEWWSEVVIDVNGYSLGRNSVISILRDKNGGAHFDTKIADPLVAAALRGELSQRISFGDSEPLPIPFLLECSARQIANELIHSIGPFISKDSRS